MNDNALFKNILEIEKGSGKEITLLSKDDTLIKKFDDIAAQLHNIQIAKNALSEVLDLYEKIDFLSVTEQQKNELMVTAFLTTFVMFYSKCFAASEDKRTKFDKDKVFNKAEKYIATHTKIMKARNSYFAHSGFYSEKEISIVYKEKNRDKEVIGFQRLITYPEKEELVSYEKTLNFVREYIINNMNEKVDVILKS